MQVGEAAQLRRYLPSQLVVADVQHFQVGVGCLVRQGSPRSGSLKLRSSTSRLERLLGTAGISPLKLVIVDGTDLSRLERLPSSAGISPFKRLTRTSSSPVTRPSSLVKTPYHSPRGASLSQFSSAFPVRTVLLRCRGQPALPGPFWRSRRPQAAPSQVQAHRWRWAATVADPVAAAGTGASVAGEAGVSGLIAWKASVPGEAGVSSSSVGLIRVGQVSSARRWPVPRLAHPSAHPSRRRPAAEMAEAVPGQRFPGKGVAFSSRFTPYVCWAGVGRRGASEILAPAGKLPASASDFDSGGSCTTETGAVETGALILTLRRGNPSSWGWSSENGLWEIRRRWSATLDCTAFC